MPSNEALFTVLMFVPETSVSWTVKSPAPSSEALFNVLMVVPDVSEVWTFTHAGVVSESTQ